MKKGFLGILLLLFVLGLFGIMLGKCQKESEKTDKIVRQTIKQEEKRKRLDQVEAENLEKEAFNNKIEEHYQRLVSAYQNKNYDEVEEVLKLFEDNNSEKYKDVENINKQATIVRLEKEVKPIPASQVEENLRIYRKLEVLDPNNPKYKKKVAYYSEKLEEKQRKSLKGSTGEIKQGDKVEP